MITRMAEVIRGWLGWCPNETVIRMAPVVMDGVPVVSGNDIPSGGGTAGSGRIDRGLRLLTGSIRITMGNRSMLWYLLLSIMICTFMFVSMPALGVTPGHLAIPGHGGTTLDPGTFSGLATLFLINVLVDFFSVFLAIGLMYSVIAGFSNRTVITRESLRYAASHVDKAVGYILLLAMSATITIALPYFFHGSPLMNTASIVLGLLDIILAVVTVFVVPLQVFERKDLVGAIAESYVFFKRSWIEILTGAMLLGLAVLGIFLGALTTAMIPAVIYGPVPVVQPISPAITLFMTVIFVIEMACVMLVATIFLAGLYTFERRGILPEIFERKQGADGLQRTPGSFSRGATLAYSGKNLIVKNTDILEFSLLTILVTVLSVFSRHIMDILTGTGPFASMVSPMVIKGSVPWAALVLANNILGNFISIFVMGGLFACIVGVLQGRNTSFGEGIRTAQAHIRDILGWVIVLSAADTVVSVALSQLSGTIPQATGVFIIILFHILTLFIVPLLIFDGRNLIDAGTGSLAMVRTLWREIAAGISVILLLFIGISIVGLIPVSLIEISSGHGLPAEGTTTLPGEILFTLAYGIAVVLFNILVITLYWYAKNGRLPGKTEHPIGGAPTS
jgi:membrane protein YdbS with pleckstrin-like domain